jgi:hypothetical protein
MAVDVSLHARTATVRPRYWSVLWRVGAAWFAAYYLTGVAALGAEALAFRGDHWGNWAMPSVDTWSGVANIPLGLAWLVLGTVLARRWLAEPGEGSTVSLPWLAGVTATAAAVQIFAVEANADGEKSGNLALLLLAAYALRRVPWDDYTPLLSRRDAFTAFLVGAVLIGGAAVAYAELRPLELQTTDCEGCDGPITEYLQNRGRDAMTVTAVAPAGVADGVRVRLGQRDERTTRIEPLTLPRTLAPGARLELVLKVRGACDGAGPIHDALVVTYRTGGDRHTALVTPDVRPTCG